jgi:hypothetical protein
MPFVNGPFGGLRHGVEGNPKDAGHCQQGKFHFIHIGFLMFKH